MRDSPPAASLLMEDDLITVDLPTGTVAAAAAAAAASGMSFGMKDVCVASTWAERLGLFGPSAPVQHTAVIHTLWNESWKVAFAPQKRLPADD